MRISHNLTEIREYVIYATSDQKCRLIDLRETLSTLTYVQALKNETTYRAPMCCPTNCNDKFIYHPYRCFLPRMSCIPCDGWLFYVSRIWFFLLMLISRIHSSRTRIVCSDTHVILYTYYDIMHVSI